MTPEMVVFLGVSLVALIAGFMMAISRNLVHAALWLILNLFAVAILYVMLSAGFFAMVQVIIYIGAIAILFIFAIMLTRRVTRPPGPRFNSDLPAAIILAIVLFAVLIWMLLQWEGFSSLPPQLPGDIDSIRTLGEALVSPQGYVIPFEVASVLLIAAMAGAIYIAWGKSGGRKSKG